MKESCNIIILDGIYENLFKEYPLHYKGFKYEESDSHDLLIMNDYWFFKVYNASDLDLDSFKETKFVYITDCRNSEWKKLANLSLLTYTSNSTYKDSPLIDKCIKQGDLYFEHISFLYNFYKFFSDAQYPDEHYTQEEKLEIQNSLLSLKTKLTFAQSIIEPLEIPTQRVGQEN